MKRINGLDNVSRIEKTEVFQEANEQVSCNFRNGMWNKIDEKLWSSLQFATHSLEAQLSKSFEFSRTPFKREL